MQIVEITYKQSLYILFCSLAFESENKDLKIILQQTEKELEDYKTMYKSQENTLRSQVGEFKDKVQIYSHFMPP